MALPGRLQVKLTVLLDCLSSVDGLINCHVANFITKNLWADLPGPVLQELENMTNLSEFTKLYLKFLCDGKSPWSKTCPNLDEFLVKSNNLSIRNDTSSLTPLHKLKAQMGELGSEVTSPPKLKDFMSEKKKHEVEETAPLAQALAQLTETTLAVDVGGGKGYLSSALSFHCGLQVLALDSSALTTSGAAKLEKKMVKHANWKELGHSRRDTVVVSPNTLLDPLLLKHFGEALPGAGVLGLHTCGDLATTCCKLFVRQNVRWLLNIGCCYHLIEEEFGKHPFWSDLDLNVTGEYGFPVSAFLKAKNARLGRNARMLAAHSLDRLMRDGVNEKAMESLFFRALLQVVVEKAKGNDLVEGQVGKLYSKCDNFHQYIRRAIQKLDLSIDLSEGDIDELLISFADQEKKLRVFFLLRTHFAPLIESVILLDRLLFLLEQGIVNSHIVALFDPALSPRNHAIVAWKPRSPHHPHVVE